MPLFRDGERNGEIEVRLGYKCSPKRSEQLLDLPPTITRL